MLFLLCNHAFLSLRPKGDTLAAASEPAKARREAQIAQQEAVEARNRVGVEIRRELGQKYLTERAAYLQERDKCEKLEKDVMRHRFILNTCTVILPDGAECEDVQQLDDAMNTH